jgi:hypothetical protein
MKKCLVASLLVFAATSVLASGPTDITGRWKFHSVISGTETDTPCALVQSERKLSGTCRVNDADVKIVGKVDNKKITFQYNSDYNGTDLTVTYTGALDDSGNIKGDVNVEPFAVSGDFTATPAK